MAVFFIAMTITISHLAPATSQEWDEIWLACDYATYFHSRQWAEIWQVYTTGQSYPLPRLVTFNDGKRALLPLSAQKRWRGLFTNYISSPGGTFGGWLACDRLELNHIKLLTDTLLTSCPNLFWRVNPYEPSVEAAIAPITETDETHVLTLDEPFEQLQKRWTKGHISAVSKARKSGITVRLAESLDDWLSYYRVYEDSLQRWGSKASSRYSWGIFEVIAQHHSPHIKLWLAIYQNQIVAGALCFYAKCHVVYWHGAALAEYFHLRPVNLLMAEAIAHACQQGFTWFDFNPSGGHPGVAAFKKSFGTTTLNCPIVQQQSSLLTVLDRVKTRIS